MGPIQHNFRSPARDTRFIAILAVTLAVLWWRHHLGHGGKTLAHPAAARSSAWAINAMGITTATRQLYLPLVETVATPQQLTGGYPIVFVSRQIPPKGSVYYHAGGSLPGVGPYSRFQVSAPGQLMIREPDGSLRTLVDGAKPTADTLTLIDVNAPDVAYDGTKIVFAALTDGAYDTKPMNNPNAWRIYTINVDGSGLQQVTFADQDDLDLSQFRNLSNQFKKYDDTDPIWLPDGRIAFSSTRWPAFGQYGGARTSNLYVVNPDGSDLHRITAERSGADRPLVDPLTGKIVYSRWWRNNHYASDSLASIRSDDGGYEQHIGLTIRNVNAPGGKDNLQRNTWQLVTINPDGTAQRLWTGRSRPSSDDMQFGYGGAFSATGVLFANYFPMQNGTEAGGFGGIRRYQRGATFYTPILGITAGREQELVSYEPKSFGVFVGSYAAEPEVLPDGRLLVSWAADTGQDYGLYVINADGSNRKRLYDKPGTTELRARVVRPRAQPPLIPDQVTEVASRLPPTEQGPYDIDGTFTFDALNVYFNAPVDAEIVSAPAVGSAGTIRFYIDHQRWENGGSFATRDWPILLQELPVSPAGAVINQAAPANVPLFEQLRSPEPEYRVPLTGGTEPLRGQYHQGGAAHVAGLNFGRPGTVESCVGCHAGHSMIPVPTDPAAAQWTNLAPGATVTVSSAHPDVKDNRALIDRRALTAKRTEHWHSDPTQEPTQQWVQLTFPVPITVRTIRLYNLPGQEPDVQVQKATIRLYSDETAATEVAERSAGPLLGSGTAVDFDDVLARVVRIETTDVTGALDGELVAALAEVEVIARGEAGP